MLGKHVSDQYIVFADPGVAGGRALAAHLNKVRSLITIYRRALADANTAAALYDKLRRAADRDTACTARDVFETVYD